MEYNSWWNIWWSVSIVLDTTLPNWACKIYNNTPFQEQLRHKQKFNLIGFDSKASSWRDRMVEVNEQNLQGAWSWIKGLTCKGSTNTLAALRCALGDPQTEAIYLLSDGRPDHVSSICNSIYLIWNVHHLHLLEHVLVISYLMMKNFDFPLW